MNCLQKAHLSALFHVPLELVDDLVLLLVPVVLNLDGLHVGAVVRLLELLLQCGEWHM